MNPKPENASTPMSNTSPLHRLSLKHWVLGVSVRLAVGLGRWGRSCCFRIRISKLIVLPRLLFKLRGKSLRVFNSAKVSKVEDAFTLETVDGITVPLSSMLNWSRTLQNGFPHEVCSHFLDGFPHYWESYGTQPSEKLPKSSASARNSSVKLNKSPIVPASLLNLHVTKMRDFVMFQRINSENLLSQFLEVLGTSEGFKDYEKIIDPSGDDKMEETKGQKDERISEKEKLSNHDLSRRMTRSTVITMRRMTRSMTRSTKARKS